MARSGFGTTSLALRATAPITALPCTMACWAYTPNTTTSQALIGLYNSSNTTNTRQTAFIYAQSAGFLGGVVGDGSSGDIVAGSVHYPASTWFHACGIFYHTATGHSIFLNGADKQTSTGNLTPSGLNRFSAGLNDNGSPSLPLVSGGAIAEVGLWNIALADSDVAVLAKGVSPLLVRPDALVGYWPLLGNNSPENDLKSNSQTMALVGALTKATHPRIILPKRKFII